MNSTLEVVVVPVSDVGRAQDFYGRLGVAVDHDTRAGPEYAVCFLAVAAMGLLFIPPQSLGETLTTDSAGRALAVAIVVATVGYLVEIVLVATRAATRFGATRRT